MVHTGKGASRVRESFDYRPNHLSVRPQLGVDVERGHIEGIIANVEIAPGILGPSYKLRGKKVGLYKRQGYANTTRVKVDYRLILKELYEFNRIYIVILSVGKFFNKFHEGCLIKGALFNIE